MQDAATDRPVHSPTGASSRSRWAKCPGSIRLGKGQPNKSSVPAEEGTAAHEVVGLAMKRAFSKNIPTRDVIKGVFEAITVYSDYVESIKADHPIHIEHSFDMGSIFPDLYGTADTVIFDKVTQILHVIDYKHGEGLVVEVKNNEQLEYYALGALHTLGYLAREVQMTIVQPRKYHPDGPIRHWRVPVIHFLDVKANIIREVKATLEPDAILLAGAHCIFCPAKNICPQKEKLDPIELKRQFIQYKDPCEEFKPIR